MTREWRPERAEIKSELVLEATVFIPKQITHVELYFKQVYKVEWGLSHHDCFLLNCVLVTTDITYTFYHVGSLNEIYQLNKTPAWTTGSHLSDCSNNQPRWIQQPLEHIVKMMLRYSTCLCHNTFRQAYSS